MRSAARKLRARLPGGDGGPTVVYARVLDGDHLWLAVADVPDHADFALDTPGGRVPLTPEAAGPLGGGGVELRADLVQLPLPPVGPGEAWTARVLAIVDSGTTWPVSLAQEHEQDVTITPRSSTGWWQHAVRRGPEGELLLERVGHDPWAEVVAIDADDDQLRAVVTPPWGAGVDDAPLAATLRPADGRELCHVDVRPVPGQPGQLAVTVPADAPVPAGTGARLVLDDHPEGSTTLVRRRRHELTYPDASVSLPGIVDARVEKPLLRWRWFPDGTLAVQRPHAGSPPVPAGGSA